MLKNVRKAGRFWGRGYVQITIALNCYWQVFPSLPWNGHLSSKLRTKPTEDVQSDCYYPSCDIATPPYVPALEGIIITTYLHQLPNDDVMV